jgi:hypothetical protein
MSSDSITAANRAVLLAALRPRADEFAAQLSRCGETLDWEWLLERATAHKVDALLASRVEIAAPAVPIRDELREHLRSAGERARANHDKALLDFALVDARFKSADISYVLVKGPVLTQIYDSPAQRSFFDLDLVVGEADVDAAQAALETMGYRLWGGERYLGFTPVDAGDLERATRAMRASLKRFAHELAFVTDGYRLIPIDLHWHLMPRGRIRSVAASELQRNITRFRIGDISTHTLVPEATLLLLAMHAWTNRPWNFALLHLCDVAWALHRLPLQPQRLDDLAERWGARGDLARSFYAVEHVLGVTVPAPLRNVAGVPSARFRRTATPENLVDQHACQAPTGWKRRQRELDWGLAMGSLPSTALLLLGKYLAVLRYHARS